jgi:hypothetical protein
VSRLIEGAAGPLPDVEGDRFGAFFDRFGTGRACPEDEIYQFGL